MRASLVRLIGVFSMILVLFPGAAPAVPRPEQVVAFVFDWDDNVFEMPTKIVLFHTRTGEQRGVTTEDFAIIREQIGKPGSTYADYELRPAPDTGSLRYFGDSSDEKRRRFANDIDRAMKAPGWQGPVWNDFVAAAARESTARHTYFITARLHAPETIHGAVDGLRARGLIRHTPPVDNIWPVSAPGFSTRFTQVFGVPAPAGGVASPSARKAAVMEQILDRVNRTPLPLSAPLVLSPGGRSRGAYHLWGFSDDDLGNFQKAVEVLQHGVDAGRWPHVKITVFYTGTNRPEVKPHAVTLRPGAPPRPHQEGRSEWTELLSARDARTRDRVPAR